MKHLRESSISSFLIISFIGNMGSQIISFGSIILLTPILLNYLGDEVFGLWAIAGSVMAYGGLFDFGLWGTIIKYVSHYNTLGEIANARRFLATIMWTYTLIAAIVLVIFFSLAPFIPGWFSASSNNAELFKNIILLVGLATSLMIPGMAPLAVLRGIKRFDFVNAVDITGTLYTTVMTIFILRSGYGVIGMIWVNISGVVLYFILGQVLLFFANPAFICHWSVPNREMFRLIISYSRSLFVHDISNRLNSKTDETTIGVFRSAAAVTPYNIARRYSDSVQIISKQLVKIFFPLTAEFFAKSDFDSLKKYLFFSTRVTLLIALGISSIFVIFSDSLIHLWLGDTLTVPAILILILSVATIFQIFQAPAAMTLKGMAKHQKLATYSVVFGLCNLGLSLILIQYFDLIGVALGTLIPAIVESIFILNLTISILEISKVEFFKNVIVPNLPPFLSIVGFGIVYHLWFSQQLLTGLNTLFLLAMLFVSYFSIYLIFAPNTMEREFLKASTLKWTSRVLGIGLK